MTLIKNIRIAGKAGADIAGTMDFKKISAITAALRAHIANGSPKTPFLRQPLSPWLRAARQQILNKRSRRGTWQINMGY